jgi:protoporphyrin/coproporphyrin ferrochelatase
MKNKIGVLLVNLGTPRSYKPSAVFRYLNEFLTDGRVIDLPWIQRQLLVRGLIVPFRFRQSSEQYRRLWTERGSPLLFHGQEVEKKLQEALGSSYQVVLAMRYQQPSIEKGLEFLKNSKVEEIIILPMFPQYASATTGSVHEKVMKLVQKWHNIPKLTFINDYFDHPAFINACYERAQQYPLSSFQHVIFSFHGLPERQIKKAYPQGKCLSDHCCKELREENRFCYKAQCYATATALVNRLALDKGNYTVSFQSRLGKEPWLEPYTSTVLHQCAKKGYKKVLVFCPSFVCDCLETTYEISQEYGTEFKKLGGDELQLVEGLNSHPAWIDALHTLVLKR